MAHELIGVAVFLPLLGFLLNGLLGRKLKNELFSGMLGSAAVGLSFLIALYSVARYVTDERWSYGALGVGLLFVLSAPLTAEDGTSVADLGFGLVVITEHEVADGT